MSLIKIQAAFVTAYITAFPSVPTAYPNVKFNPPAGKWVKFDFVPSPPFVFSLGNGGDDMQRGVVSLSFFYPQDTGTADFYDDFEICRSTFVAGKFFTYSDQSAKVISCGASGPVSDGPWLRGNVAIDWEALIKRTTI